VAERFETFDQAMGRANGVAFVEVIGTEILVGGGPTGRNYLLMYIQTTAVTMHSHGSSPLPLAKTPALKDSP